MTIIEFLNLALIIALIIYSVRCFKLRFESNRVCTIKDLLLAFVTGGSLAVTTLVFGVTGDIMGISNEIRNDTQTIRSTLGVEREFDQAREAADVARERPTQNLATTNDIENLARLINQNGEMLKGVLRVTSQISNNVTAGLTCVVVNQQNNSFNSETGARLSREQAATNVTLVCKIPG